MPSSWPASSKDSKKSSSRDGCQRSELGAGLLRGWCGRSNVSRQCWIDRQDAVFRDARWWGEETGQAPLSFMIFSCWTDGPEISRLCAYTPCSAARPVIMGKAKIGLPETHILMQNGRPNFQRLVRACACACVPLPLSRVVAHPIHILEPIQPRRPTPVDSPWSGNEVLHDGEGRLETSSQAGRQQRPETLNTVD